MNTQFTESEKLYHVTLSSFPANKELKLPQNGIEKEFNVKWLFVMRSTLSLLTISMLESEGNKLLHTVKKNLTTKEESKINLQDIGMIESVIDKLMNGTLKMINIPEVKTDRDLKKKQLENKPVSQNNENTIKYFSYLKNTENEGSVLAQLKEHNQLQRNVLLLSESLVGQDKTNVVSFPEAIPLQKVS